MSARGERIIRLTRDLGCIITGLGVVAHQTLVVPPGKASEALLVAAVALVGYPAGALLSRGGTTSTTEPSSSGPSPPSSSPSPSSSSPASSGAGDPP